MKYPLFLMTDNSKCKTYKTGECKLSRYQDEVSVDIDTAVHWSVKRAELKNAYIATRGLPYVAEFLFQTGL